MNGHLVRPFSYSANVKTHRCSTPLERRYTDFGADDPFADVPSKMKEHYGITLPVHLPRTITEKHAKKMKELETLKNIFPEQGAGIIISQVDGSMIPIVTIAPKTTDDEPSDGRKRRKVEWKEAKLSLAHPLGSVTPMFSATMEGAEDAGDHMLTCAILAGGGENSKIHCVGDGAPWIASQVDRVFSVQGSYLIDFMHLCEYLSPASKSCCSNDSLVWLDTQKQLMKEGNISSVIQALEPYIETATTPDDKAPVRQCHRYISNRLDQFDYKSAIEANLPIGSGEVESAHRYVIQKRLKLSGAWWERSNAQNMLALRVLRVNGGWEDYWKQQDFKLAA